MRTDWYPRHYYSMSDKTPIVIILIGAGGNSEAKYAKILSEYVEQRGWRSCIIIR